MLSNRINDENSKASVDNDPEVEEEQLKSSLKCEVAVFRWSSKAFSSKLTMSRKGLKVENPMPLELYSELVPSSDVIKTLIESDDDELDPLIMDEEEVEFPSKEREESSNLIAVDSKESSRVWSITQIIGRMV